MMKQIFTIILSLSVTFLLLVGCQETTSFTGNEPQLKQSLNFLSLPPSSEGSLAKRFKTKPITITPENGGVITFNEKYMSGNVEVKVSLELKFEKHSVPNPVSVFLSIDESKLAGYVAIEYGTPYVELLKPATLNLKISGLDPTLLNNTVSAWCLWPTGAGWVYLDYDRIIIDMNKGVIDCRGVKIPYFSEFAITNN